MAYVAEQYCFTCDADTMHTNNQCGVCKSKQDKKEREIYFDKLDKMTLEQRVRRIEEWIFNHNREYNIFDR
jgi:hypothetical protein